MKIHVTQKHINQGRQKSCHYCPVALALTAKTKCVWIVGQYVANQFTPSQQNFPLPPEVTTFIDRFDNNQEVTPFEFELDSPLPL